MNDKELNKGIQDLKNISLSQDEKKAMLLNVTTYAEFHAPKIKTEKVQIWSFFQSKSSYAYSALGLILVVSTSVYGAEKALPGDILYPFKVNVNESLKSALINSPDAQAKWESERLIRRIEEAEMLAKEGKLDDVSLLEVENRIDKHFEKFNNLSPSRENKSVQNSAREGATLRMKTAPEVAPMMITAQFNAEDSALADFEKDEFELEIENHKTILQSIKTENKDQNERIERLEKKLSEKVLKRAEKRREQNGMATTSLPVIENKDSEILNDSTEDSNGANVFEGRGKGKSRKDD